LDTSPEDIKQLIEQIRDLTARVHRVEQLLRIAPAASSPVAREVTAAQPPASPQQPSDRPAEPAVSIKVSDAASPLPNPLRDAENDHRDNLEARIGSHWLNRIGITAVLIGAALFLKLAIDNRWIGETGRIAIGLISGIAVVLWSERFRSKGYRLFSFSLKAVGIGVLYLSLWAAFQVYHLMPSGIVFACMLIVTCSTCAMALTQDAEIRPCIRLLAASPLRCCCQPESIARSLCFRMSPCSISES